MIVGLISDTHGDAARTAKAAMLFRRAGVKAILHAGDVCGEGILDELRALDVPIHAVAGNCDDGDLPSFLDVKLDGKRFAIAHGHDPIRLKNAIRAGNYEYVITGHTHERRDERIGETRVINPGAVFRASPPSVAVLDTATDTLRFIDVHL